MVDIPEQAVQAAIEAIDDYYDAPECVGEAPMKAALTAAALHMSGVKVKAGRAVCYVSKDGEAISDILDMPSDFIYDALKAKRDNEPAPPQRAQALEEAAILEALEECETYFDNLSDADHDGTGFVANKEMRLLMSVRSAIRTLKSQPAPQLQSLVIIESPYAGDIAANESYARACLLDCLRRGEAPIASHLLHTQVLDDMQPDERELGIEAGLAWYRVADKCVVYADRGVSGGMAKGIERANRFGVPVEYRTLNEGAGTPQTGGGE